MQDRTSNFDLLLKRIDLLGREIEQIKRDLLQNMPRKRRTGHKKHSLFGSVQGGDVTEEMILEAQQHLFRP